MDKKVKKGPAYIKVSSVPSEAKIFINGYYKGKTPMKVSIVSAGQKKNYKVTLIKPGYTKWAEIISLESRDSTKR